jgi:Cof subfamily protein (haloacid dehalogenase superfamily)
MLEFVTEPVFGLVATDLDGTLLRTDHTVGRRTREALARVATHGTVHVVATGRSAAWSRAVLDDLGYRGLAVCGQGGQVYDTAARAQVFSVQLDPAVAAEALSRIEALTGRLVLAADRDGTHGAVVAGPGYRPDPAEGLAVAWAEQDFALWAAPVRKLYVQHPEWDEERLAEAAEQAAGHLVTVLQAGPGEIEILPRGVTKATGLAWVARRLGLCGEDAVAFGDMPNDVPMLAWAAHGVAMSGAHPELLAVADEVAPGNDEEGVAVILERLFASATPCP